MTILTTQHDNSSNTRTSINNSTILPLSIKGSQHERNMKIETVNNSLKTKQDQFSDFERTQHVDTEFE